MDRDGAVAGTTHRRRLRCVDMEREVEVEFDGAIACRRRCLDAAYRRLVPPALRYAG